MKLLPFSPKPIFLSYHGDAFPFGIIQANNNESILKWVCSKCVNCAYFPGSPMHRFVIDAPDIWGMDEGLVSYQTILLKKDSFELYGVDLLQFLKAAVRDNTYINGWYNEYYIPNKLAYNRYDFMHDFLIIGCDDEKFISVGYVADGTFKQFEIPNQNMMNSLMITDNERIHLNLFRYNQGVVPSPNFNRMIKGMKDYISTADYLNHPTPDLDSFGLSTHYRVKQFFLDEVNRGRSYIDRKCTRVLFEHKWVLKQLVQEFFGESGKEKHQGWTTENYEKAQKIHLLGLKMTATKNRSIINSISLLMDQIIESEIRHIPELILDLENNLL